MTVIELVSKKKVSKKTPKMIRELLELDLLKGLVKIIKRDGEDVGFINYKHEGNSIHIYSINIVKSKRRQGTATEVIEHLRRTYRHKSITGHCKDDSVKFWKSLGAEISRDEIIRGYYPIKIDSKSKTEEK